jgi:hypothetical protein
VRQPKKLLPPARRPAFTLPFERLGEHLEVALVRVAETLAILADDLTRFVMLFSTVR